MMRLPSRTESLSLLVGTQPGALPLLPFLHFSVVSPWHIVTLRLLLPAVSQPCPCSRSLPRWHQPCGWGNPGGAGEGAGVYGTAPP
mmetsp:Transcript_6846/g.13526  ORF Transcript_6846/g.13526 Transcript_6846/m.13526 type:complete len:86 (-) Transcript_6846:113-370(-)